MYAMLALAFLSFLDVHVWLYRAPPHKLCDILFITENPINNTKSRFNPLRTRRCWGSRIDCNCMHVQSQRALGSWMQLLNGTSLGVRCRLLLIQTEISVKPWKWARWRGLGKSFRSWYKRAFVHPQPSYSSPSTITTPPTNHLPWTAVSKFN